MSRKPKNDQQKPPQLSQSEKKQFGDEPDIEAIMEEMTETPPEPDKKPENSDNTVRELSQDDKDKMDKDFFCPLFVRALKAPNIYFRYVKKRKGFVTLDSLDPNNPEVRLASDEFYEKFMPQMKSMLGPFEHLFEIYEEYKGMIGLACTIGIGITMELQLEREENAKKGSEGRAGNSDIRETELGQDNEDAEPVKTAS